MSELALRDDGYLTMPHSGELIKLADARLMLIAEAVTEIRELESRLREAKAILAAEVCRRADLQRTWTLHDGPVKVSVPSDALVSVWDTDALLEVLDDMVSAGEISTDAMNRAIQARVDYKVLATGIGALLKSPTLADRIEACRTLVPPTDRRISVSMP